MTHNVLLTHLLAPYTPSHSLCSQDKCLLSEPAVSTSRSLSYAAPSTWNMLLEICSISSFAFSNPPYHLPPSDCPRLRFSPPADHVQVVNVNIVLCCCWRRWHTQRRSHTCVLSVAKHSPTRATWSSIGASTMTTASLTAASVASSCRRPQTSSATCIFTTQSATSRVPSAAAGFPPVEIWCATSACIATISHSCVRCAVGRSAERLTSRCTATHTQVPETRLLA